MRRSFFCSIVPFFTFSPVPRAVLMLASARRSLLMVWPGPLSAAARSRLVLATVARRLWTQHGSTQYVYRYIRVYFATAMQDLEYTRYTRGVLNKKLAVMALVGKTLGSLTARRGANLVPHTFCRRRRFHMFLDGSGWFWMVRDVSGC